ncbi:MAG TPA: thymidine phosphorylase [Verrucomicrobiae bacterium]|nr:thymidine phosphorylase [Verrucomicrobiae bacterium]
MAWRVDLQMAGCYAPAHTFNCMRAVDLIRKKRDSGEHSREEIEFLISGYTRGEIPDYQIAAWLMSAWIRGLSRTETTALTQAMLHSGEVLDLSSLPGKKVDKHSTGGVGDKTSLILAPIVAAGGLIVPMLSGRGLGHTGGTLDKLESIPGFNTNLSLKDFRRVLGECGMALIGQTAEIAPADKKIYALRDATSTVENTGFICASIMSKKLAEGLDALVLDVKSGSGAFMKREEDAMGLAEVMVDAGKSMGKRMVALITDMDQPLGRAAGHANEITECIEVLNGKGPADVRELSVELSAWMFYLGEKTKSVEEGRKLAAQMISSGQAREKFRQCIRLQGGDERVIDEPDLLPTAASKLDVTSNSGGVLVATDCQQFGIALAMLGGGRETKEDRIDHAVGLEFHKRIGERIEIGEPLATIHYNSDAKLAEAKDLVAESFVIDQNSGGQRPRPLIRRIIGA